MPHEISREKAPVRKEILRRRDSIPADIRPAKNRAIEERVLALPQFAQAGTVMLYASFGSEVGTRNLISYCLSKGLRTALPKVNRKTGMLDIYIFKYVGELAPGCWGIPEPPASAERELKLEDVDIVIAPAVAFDEQCNRLGYGKGYYDRLLRTGKRPFVAGLAYEEQIVPFLSSDQYDIKMDVIITEKRIISCHGS